MDYFQNVEEFVAALQEEPAVVNRWLDVMNIPKIDNIHQVVLDAVTTPTPDGKKALNMSDWHQCSTVHCWGGWVVALGKKKGRALEALFDTEMAAVLIYHVNSPIKMDYEQLVNHFYNFDNKEALNNIKAFAKQEKKYYEKLNRV